MYIMNTKDTKLVAIETPNKKEKPRLCSPSSQKPNDKNKPNADADKNIQLNLNGGGNQEAEISHVTQQFGDEDLKIEKVNLPKVDFSNCVGLFLDEETESSSSTGGDDDSSTFLATQPLP